MSEHRASLLTPVEQAMSWERMSGERLSNAERQRLLDGGEWRTPTPDVIHDLHAPVPPRPVETALLDQFDKWTHTDELFTRSMEGRAFAEELREAFRLARKALRHG